MYNSEVEEIQLVQKSMKHASTEVPTQVQEKKSDAMDVGDIEDLPKLFISPAEKFMDEFDGNSKDLKGLFKIPTETNLRLICINKFAIPQKTNMNPPMENATFMA